MKQWKIKNLDSKSPSFCGAKWYNTSIWLYSGQTTSCHHNPPHTIDIDAIKINPMAMHNTPIKKNERRMMQLGEKPKNCQFCWVMEEVEPDGLADRTWMSRGPTEDQLDAAFNNSFEHDYDVTYLEIGFDRTCNLACSYCEPAISTTWAKDIRKNGPYENLQTDKRNHYTSTKDNFVLYDFNDHNPYADAFFKWWDTSLHKTIKHLRITGGEPMMSGHTWKLLDWLANNPNKSNCRIDMTTNLSYDHDTLMRFLDKCSKIDQSIHLASSSESIGAKDEYIRDGLDWNLWQENLIKVLSSGVIKNTGICTTISAAAADGFAEFLYWIFELKKQWPHQALMVSVNPVRFPTFQNISVLPQHLRDMYSDEIDEFLSQPLIDKYFHTIEIDHITRFSSYLRTVKSPHSETALQHNNDQFTSSQNNDIDQALLEKDFKQFFTQYDKRRGKDFVSTFPRLKNWYESIQT